MRNICNDTFRTFQPTSNGTQRLKISTLNTSFITLQAAPLLLKHIAIISGAPTHWVTPLWHAGHILLQLWKQFVFSMKIVACEGYVYNTFFCPEGFWDLKIQPPIWTTKVVLWISVQVFTWKNWFLAIDPGCYLEYYSVLIHYFRLHKVNKLQDAKWLELNTLASF